MGFYQQNRPSGSYHFTLQIGTEGDGYHDTFFPVWWWGSPSSWGHRKVTISRTYSAAGPSTHGTHKASLGFEMICGSNDWGGHSHNSTLLHHSWLYRQTVAGFGGTAHNMKNYVLLRAGGYQYQFVFEGYHMNSSNITIGNHTSNQNTYTAGSPAYLSATTTASLATKAWT